MNWIKRLFSKPKQDTLARFRNEPLKLTLIEWQKNGQLVSAAMAVARLPIWRAMMEVMHNECPAFNFGFKLEGTPITDRAALQLLTEGYMMAINNLNTMASVPSEEKELPVADFAPEERMKG